MTATHFDPNACKARVLRDAYGFVSKTDVASLAADDTSRLWLLLVRCGGCRFLCAAQDVAHLIACVEAGHDYVRDVSFPVEAD